MLTAAVSIGRNIGGEPMPADEWQHFQSDVRAALFDHADTFLTAATGTGAWGEVAEDSAVWLVLIGSTDARRLRRRLAQIASQYRQEAVGFTAAPAHTTLIPATREVANV